MTDHSIFRQLLLLPLLLPFKAPNNVQSNYAYMYVYRAHPSLNFMNFYFFCPRASKLQSCPKASAYPKNITSFIIVKVCTHTTYVYTGVCMQYSHGGCQAQQASYCVDTQIIPYLIYSYLYPARANSRSVLRYYQ